MPTDLYIRLPFMYVFNISNIDLRKHCPLDISISNFPSPDFPASGNTLALIPTLHSSPIKATLNFRVSRPWKLISGFPDSGNLLRVSALHYSAGDQVMEGFWTVTSAHALCQPTSCGSKYFYNQCPQVWNLIRIECSLNRSEHRVKNE